MHNSFSSVKISICEISCDYNTFTFVMVGNKNLASVMLDFTLKYWLLQTFKSIYQKATSCMNNDYNKIFNKNTIKMCKINYMKLRTN